MPVPSSSLIPFGDETLLFTNAGMVQFKEVFLGSDKRDYSRAVTAQKCLRAGGKHNDLENVGYTARHHTFFEMLGNFSFGDYFKREAIAFAWKFLTEIVALPAERLWITVFEEDQEAEEIWLKEIGVDPTRFSRIGAKDNFWSMGDTGPCGPCTEIFYDHGSSVAGGPPGSPEEDGDRYIEIWNLVFMQYNRLNDGTLEKLPNPSVDTGMGLERLAAVLQGVHSNYEIDLFKMLIARAARIIGTDEMSSPSLKVIADHIRAVSFLIADGVLPSNEGRGYVLRRIIRRAARHGHKLGVEDCFLYRLVPQLIELMGEAYPELVEKRSLIIETLEKEEQQFMRTLSHGMKIFEQNVAGLNPGQIIDGTLAFKLYDTYGFPLDLTADIAREKGLGLDLDGFEREMDQQKQRAKSTGKFSQDYNKQIKSSVGTEFRGYSETISESHVLEIFVDENPVTHIDAGQKAVLVLNHTPFYAESGGQVGDRGVIEAMGVKFQVDDTQRSGSSILHIGCLLSGSLHTGTEVSAIVDIKKRRATAGNHTATHLLHAALRLIIGEHVEQKGSLVDSEKLRFDFSNPSAVSFEQLQEVEKCVNGIIRDNRAVETIETTPEHAKALGAMALFGEKYGDYVRVLKIGDFSIELCGGTHVKRSGDIGLFKIVSESGVASGIRRIEAVTANAAEDHVYAKEELIETANELLKSNDQTFLDRLIRLQQQLKQKEKELTRLKQQLVSGSQTELEVKKIGDIDYVTGFIANVDMAFLREKVDQYKAKHPQIIVVLATESNDKAQFAIGVTKSLIDRIKAGDLAGYLAAQVGGKGGGRPDMAQAGGVDSQNIDKALGSVAAWLTEKLQ